jgi:hypothetical protein
MAYKRGLSSEKLIAKQSRAESQSLEQVQLCKLDLGPFDLVLLHKL